MLTIFTVPKPFRGHIDLIQRNALGSWRKLRPECTLVLCGKEEGTEAAAREFGAIFLPDIPRSPLGTPLLDAVFAEACRVASTRLVCYCNADILLLDDFLQAIQRIPLENFLMIGQRTTLDLRERLDFADPGWADRLREMAVQKGQLDGPTAIDYMVFPRESPLRQLPPFAVGRPGWDNWFVERARQLAIPVISATKMVRVMHQKHDYSHVPLARGTNWEGPEAVHNRKLVGWPAQGKTNAYTIRDASYLLTPNGLRPNVNWGRRFPIRVWAAYPLRLARRWARKLRLLRRLSTRPTRLLAFCRYSIRLKLGMHKSV